MSYSMLAKLEALREEALVPARVLDEAIVKLGGKSLFGAPVRNSGHPASVSAVADALAERAKAVGENLRRLTQVGAAEAILRESGSPMTVYELMEALPSKGVTLQGENRQINFTSALSKSNKFRSERRGGNYYWWFKYEPLPPDWQEAPDLLSKEGSDASHVGYQEGGEANATAT